MRNRPRKWVSATSTRPAAPQTDLAKLLAERFGSDAPRLERWLRRLMGKELKDGKKG
jgi:hypothetical protein